MGICQTEMHCHWTKQCISAPVKFSKINHKILQSQIFMVLRLLTVQINIKEYFQQHRRGVGVLPPVQSIGVKCLKTSGNLSVHAGLNAAAGESVTNQVEH